MNTVEEYPVRHGPTILFAARFPTPEAERIKQACAQLNISKTELIVAGTIAELDRRLREENGADVIREVAP